MFVRQHLSDSESTRLDEAKLNLLGGTPAPFGEAGSFELLGPCQQQIQGAGSELREGLMHQITEKSLKKTCSSMNET